MPGDNIASTKRTSQAIDNLSFDEDLLVRVTEIVGANGVLINPATEETSKEIDSRNMMIQYLASLITRDQAQATDGSKRVTVLNALQLNSINPPSSSTSMLIYSWTQDLSRVSVATNLIANIK